MGICHSYTPDGRCVSLLKILLTNFCIYDCLYCVNRRLQRRAARALHASRRWCDLTLDFYRRNYIEGLFLSSGIIQSPDYTMEQLVEVARTLREDHRFGGYIHLKTMPGRRRRSCSRRRAATPTGSASTSSCRRAADLSSSRPEKTRRTIERCDGRGCRRHRRGRRPNAAREPQRAAVRAGRPEHPDDRRRRRRRPTRASCDQRRRSTTTYRLRRVYYSALQPDPATPTRPAAEGAAADARAPAVSGRLADALLRLHARELTTAASAEPRPGDRPEARLGAAATGAVSRRRQHGAAGAAAAGAGPGRAHGRAAPARRGGTSVRLDDLGRCGCSWRSPRPFIVTADWQPGGATARRSSSATLVQPLLWSARCSPRRHARRAATTTWRSRGVASCSATANGPPAAIALDRFARSGRPGARRAAPASAAAPPAAPLRCMRCRARFLDQRRACGVPPRPGALGAALPAAVAADARRARSCWQTPLDADVPGCRRWCRRCARDDPQDARLRPLPRGPETRATSSPGTGPTTSSSGRRRRSSSRASAPCAGRS